MQTVTHATKSVVRKSLNLMTPIRGRQSNCPSKTRWLGGESSRLWTGRAGVAAVITGWPRGGKIIIITVLLINERTKEERAYFVVNCKKRFQ